MSWRCTPFSTGKEAGTGAGRSTPTPRRRAAGDLRSPFEESNCPYLLLVSLSRGQLSF
ncbi:MAG: hypothetical protein L6W00_15615 [Lentisphaeria bacterium]|nr:MAG: hypothetical protein L6W00_15615 [Lentisphaeria bacterium]